MACRSMKGIRGGERRGVLTVVEAAMRGERAGSASAGKLYEVVGGATTIRTVPCGDRARLLPHAREAVARRLGDYPLPAYTPSTITGAADF